MSTTPPPGAPLGTQGPMLHVSRWRQGRRRLRPLLPWVWLPWMSRQAQEGSLVPVLVAAVMAVAALLLTMTTEALAYAALARGQSGLMIALLTAMTTFIILLALTLPLVLVLAFITLIALGRKA